MRGIVDAHSLSVLFLPSSGVNKSRREELVSRDNIQQNINELKSAFSVQTWKVTNS